MNNLNLKILNKIRLKYKYNIFENKIKKNSTIFVEFFYYASFFVLYIFLCAYIKIWTNRSLMAKIIIW